MKLQKFFLLLILAISHGQTATRTWRFTPGKSEAELAFGVRLAGGCQSTVSQQPFDIDANNNGDEQNVPNFAAQFSKLLEHDSATSVLTLFGQQQYQQLCKALQTDLQTDFNAIIRNPGVKRLFVNPQAGFTWNMQGIDSSLPPMPKAPSLTSPVAAAEMLEIYLQAICRDVRFEDYGTGKNSDFDALHGGGSITQKASNVLTALIPNYQGPTEKNGKVTPRILFRGISKGDLIGPYVSQFLLQPIYPLFPSGCAPFVAKLIGVQNLNQDVLLIPQCYPIPEKREFGISWADFIQLQDGFIPKQYTINDYDQHFVRYAIDGRDLAGYVHTDGPYQAYYVAVNILIYQSIPLSPAFPYSNGSITNETAGINMGGPDAFGLIAGASLEAFKAAWAEKWRAQRRLRPEAMAGLIHKAKVTGTNPYNLDPSIFQIYDGIDVLAWTKQRNAEQALYPANNMTPQEAGTYLLSQMYPEGSPAHPSYPSGHATVAGACTTVIKAIYNDTALLKDYLTPAKVDPTDPRKLVPLHNEGEDQMTVGSELDKLATNIAFARNFGGIHYRSDGRDGILLGEEIAIRYLQNHACIYPEQGFNYFELTKRDGVRIRITATSVEVIG